MENVQKIDISELMKKAMASAPAMDAMQGLCGIPKDGLKIRLTASAEMVVEPLKCEEGKNGKVK